jgi:hypothetical protein
MDSAHPADPDEVKGLGDSPVTLRLQLDNQSVIEIAVEGDKEHAQGPFFRVKPDPADTSDLPSQSSGEAA